MAESSRLDTVAATDIEIQDVDNTGQWLESPLPENPRRAAMPLPSELDKFMINIELRDGSRYGLSDPPQIAHLLPITMLLSEEYHLLETKKLRASHFSWPQFCDFIHKTFNFELAPADCELGFTVDSPSDELPKEYFEISSASAFGNAISVVVNSPSPRRVPSALTLYLWKPIRKEPLFRRSRRAPEGLITTTPKDPTVAQCPKPAPVVPPLSPKNPVADLPTSPLHQPLIDTLTDQTTSAQHTTAEGVEIDFNRLEKEVGIRGPLHAPVKEADETEDEFDLRMRQYLDDLRDEQLRSLQRGLNSAKTMHLSPEIWVKVCTFFHHTVPKPEPKYSVAIKYFGRKLLPVQAHGVWWSLTQSIHNVQGSIFLAHVPGIGKTTMSYAIHFVQHTINRMWVAIEKSPEGHYDSEQILEECQSNFCSHNNDFLNKYGFDCPCSPSSPTHPVKKKLGVTVALVPFGLMATWTNEHAACFNTRARKAGTDCCPMLVRAHGGDFSDDAMELLRGDEDEMHYLDKDGKDSDLAPSQYHPRIENGRVFVIGTANSFEKRFLAPTTGRKWFMAKQKPQMKPVKGNKEKFEVYQPPPKQIATDPYPTVIVSLFFRDEFHFEKNNTSWTLKELRKLQDRQGRVQKSGYLYYRISLIPLSGTPLTAGPGDIAHWVKAMVRPEWKYDPVLCNWSQTEVLDSAKNWEKACKKNEPDLSATISISKSLEPLVERLFVRYTTESNFLGYHCVIVPKTLFQEVFCDHDPAWNMKLEGVYEDMRRDYERRDQKRKAAFKKRHGTVEGYEKLKTDLPNSYYRARICAIIPGLADLKDANGVALRLTEKEWVEHKKAPLRPLHNSDVEDTDSDIEVPLERWVPETPSDPYFANIKMLAASSGKFKAIGAEIDRLENVIDAQGKKCRMIWMTYFYIAAWSFYLWMVHVRGVPKEDIIFVHSMQTEKQREAELLRFHGDLDKPDFLTEKTARYIIATSMALGHGVTLAEASSCALLEPDYRPAVMVQVLGRHCRQGNKNKKVYSKIYIAKNSKAEQRICLVNKMRSSIETAAAARDVSDTVSLSNMVLAPPAVQALPTVQALAMVQTQAPRDYNDLYDADA